jgi:integrase
LLTIRFQRTAVSASRLQEQWRILGISWASLFESRLSDEALDNWAGIIDEMSMYGMRCRRITLSKPISTAGIRDGGKSPLFRSAAGRTGALTATAMNRVDAWRMIQRRAAELGTRARIGCHTFRATGITAYLKNGGTLEKAASMANHASTRTTQLYDRRAEEVTLDEVEGILV